MKITDIKTERTPNGFFVVFFYTWSLGSGFPSMIITDKKPVDEESFIYNNIGFAVCTGGELKTFKRELI